MLNSASVPDCQSSPSLCYCVNTASDCGIKLILTLSYETAGLGTLQSLIHRVGKYHEGVVLQLQNPLSYRSDCCINTEYIIWGGDVQRCSI